MNYSPYRINRARALNGGRMHSYFILPLLVVAGTVAAIGMTLAIAAAAPVFLVMSLIPKRARVGTATSSTGVGATLRESSPPLLTPA